MMVHAGQLQSEVISFWKLQREAENSWSCVIVDPKPGKRNGKRKRDEKLGGCNTNPAGSREEGGTEPPSSGGLAFAKRHYRL